MAQVGRQDGQLGLNIGSAAVPVQQSVHGETVAQVVLKPTSA